MHYPHLGTNVAKLICPILTLVVPTSTSIKNFKSYPIEDFFDLNWLFNNKLLPRYFLVKVFLIVPQVSNLLANLVLPEKEDFEFGSSYGLVTMQEHNQFDVGQMAKGEFGSNEMLFFKTTSKSFNCGFNWWIFDYHMIFARIPRLISKNNSLSV